MPGSYGSPVKTYCEIPDVLKMDSRPAALRYVLAIAALLCVDVRANRVLSITSNEEQVTLTNEVKQRRWQLNEAVCLVKEGEELACGFIGALTEKTVVVQIESRSFKVLPGFDVTLKREGRLVSSAGDKEDRNERSAVTVARRAPTIDLSFGPVAGLNYFFPVVAAAQFRMDRKFTVGIDLRYSTFCAGGVTGSTCLGAMLSLNYYYTQYAFRGLFFSAGAGLYQLNLDNGPITETVSPLAFQGTVGWRIRPRWGMALDFSVMAGAQVVLASTTTLRNEFRGLLPVMGIALGYSF